MMTLSSIRRAYKEYLDTPHGCDVYAQFKDILYSSGDSLVSSLNDDVLQPIVGLLPPDFRICDIGGGDGYRVSRIEGYCEAKFRADPYVDVVEQSAELCGRYRKRQALEKHRGSVVHAAFEDASLQAASYDLVLLIHSIFALTNGAAIEKVLELPRAGGYVVVVSNAEDSFLAGLKQMVDLNFEDRRFEIGDVEAALRNLNVGYERRILETRWAITEAELDASTQVILEWISLGAYAGFDEPRKKKIQEYVISQSRLVGSRRLFCEREVVLVLGPAGGPEP